MAFRKPIVKFLDLRAIIWTLGVYLYIIDSKIDESYNYLHTYFIRINYKFPKLRSLLYIISTLYSYYHVCMTIDFYNEKILKINIRHTIILLFINFCTYLLKYFHKPEHIFFFNLFLLFYTMILCISFCSIIVNKYKLIPKQN